MSGAGETGPGRGLRIATFNLENLGGGGNGDAPALQRRVAALRPLMERLEADVLCLQEVNARAPKGGGPRRPDGLDALVDGTAYAGYARCLSLGTTGKRLADRHNLAILSGLPIRHWRSLRHAHVPAPRLPAVTAGRRELILEFDRPLLYAALDLPDGRLLHALDLHLRAPLAAAFPGGKRGGSWRSTATWAEGLHHAAVLRSAQALEARLLVEEIFDAEPDALIAVCGDFNAEGDAAALGILSAPAERTGLADRAGRALNPLDAGLPEGERYSLRHAGQALLVDHILVSPALFSGYRQVHSLNAELIDDTAAEAQRLEGSLHAPLVAEFDL
jgi:endonuclease/exonuclease/phosphatase family metal-dependent hydrolase